MREQFNEIFDRHDVSQPVRDYVFGDTDQLPMNESFFWWDEIFEACYPLAGERHEYMLRSYQMLLNSDDVERWSYFVLHHLVPEGEGQYRSVVLKMIELLNLAGERDDFKNMIQVAKHSRWLAGEVIDYLYNRRKDQLFDVVRFISPDYYGKDILNHCMKIDRALFGDYVIDQLRGCSNLHDYLIDFLPEIDDIKTVIELIRAALRTYFTEQKMKGRDLKLIDAYLDGKRSDKIDLLLDRVLSAFYTYKYNDYFLNNLGRYMVKNSDHRLLPLKTFLLMINPVDQIEYYFHQGLSGEELMADYDLPFDRYLHYVINYIDDYDDSTAVRYERLFNGYLESDIESIGKVLPLLKIDKMIALIKRYADHPNMKQFVIDFAPIASGKKVIGMIVELLQKDQNNLEAVTQFLKHKKKGAREIAVAILKGWKHPDTVTLFQDAVAIEKNSKLKKEMNDYLATMEAISADPEDYYSKEAVIERAKKIKSVFVDLKGTPSLIWKETGAKLNQSVTKYLIKLLQKGDKVLRATPETVEIINCFTPESFKALIDTLVTRDYPGEWIYRAMPLIGSDHYLDYIQEQMGWMISRSRGAAAAKLVDSISEFQTPKAIQLLDHLTLKKNARDARVNRAAIAALEETARKMKLTRDDLLDLIIPDFGFSNRGELILDFGPRQFTVRLLPDLSLTITDSNGKNFKNLPKVGKSDDPDLGKVATDRFKGIKKELKKQVKLQRERLERGFSDNRLWRGDQWRKVFLNNPVMGQFAMGLIWGIYSNGRLIDQFRYREDGTCGDINDDDFVLKDEQQIGLIHPVELEAEAINSWGELLADDEIIQPFNQLNRRVFTINDGEEEQKLWIRFRGYMVGRFPLRNGLMKTGWERGPVEDAGCYYSYGKALPGDLYVTLNFLGDYIGNYDDNKEVPLHNITLSRGRKAVAISELPPRVYSELVLELEGITGKGSGFNPDWKDAGW